jgi:hypothetical protein
MRLKVPKVSLRSIHNSGERGVMDEDTGKTVGQLLFSPNTSHMATHKQTRRQIHLLGGKYVGNFNSHDECVAFAKGVEAVLNHMVSTDD